MKSIGVFARWPEAGRVKSRLSPALPAALACRLHRALVLDTAEMAGAVPAARSLLYWSDAPAGRPDFPLPGGVEPRDQRGADLGERLARALAEMLEAANEGAVAIGTDCPDLEAPVVVAAFEALRAHDLVLGPTRDGGYYLIGLKRPAPALFAGMEWGTERVLEQTLARAASAGLKAHRLETLEDVDTPADLIRLIARLAGGGTAARHTREVLSAMGLLPGA